MGSRHLCAKATASTCPGASLGGVFRNRASQWMTIGLPTCLAGRSTFGGRALEAADIDAVPVVAIKPAMVSVSRCAQVIFTQSLPRPET
jgi:hypothetical protein